MSAGVVALGEFSMYWFCSLHKWIV